MATIAKHLHKLTSKSVEFVWTAAEQHAFDSLKKTLVSAEVLGYPDPKLPYIRMQMPVMMAQARYCHRFRTVENES